MDSKIRLSLLAGVWLLLGFSAPLLALPPWVEYHDYTGAEHQTEFNLLYDEGYRLISLSVYGDPSAPLYAAVWVQEDGPPWASEQAMTGAQFQSYFDQYAAEGLKVTQIAATGPANNPLFAAVWEQSSDGSIPYTRFGLVKATSGPPYNDSSTVDYWLTTVARQTVNEGSSGAPNPRNTELIPSTIAVYGTAAAPNYALVLEPNPSRIGWNADAGLNGTYLDDATLYQDRFNAQVSQWHRPVVVPVSYDQNYLGLFRDDFIGPWVANHDLDLSGLEAAISNNVALGYMPVSVQGGGSVAGEFRYTAIFAQNLEPQARQFTATGRGNAPGVDSVIQQFMAANGLHHAGLAVVEGTRLVLARGYTYAAPGYPLATPTTYFRTASLAKPMTSIALQKLLQDQSGTIRFTDSSYVQDILKWQSNYGNPPADPNFGQITLGQLLQHISGIPGNNDFSEPGVAQALNALEGLSLSPPITQDDMREWVVTNSQLTNQKPGTGSPWPAHTAQYSNLGYWILARVIEKLSGVPYMTYLQNSVAAPLGSSHIRLRTDNVADQPVDEARYYDHWSQVGVPQWYWPSVDSLAPFPYGVDWTSLYDGSGGISIAPVDYARIIASLNVRSGNPILTPQSIDNILSNSFGFDGSPYSPWVPPLPSPYVVDKGGLFSGTQSVVLFTQNDMSYVAFWDRDDVYFYDPNWYPVFQELVNAINAVNFGSVDYFPDFGMPSFSALSFTRRGNTLSITSGLNGTLQSTTSLVRPAWTDVGPITAGTPVNIAMDHTIPAKFYRLRTQ